ncbi:MAG: O-antigen ligase family protein [Patescibacteria group bacterium]
MFEILVTILVLLLPFQFALYPAEGVDLALARVWAIAIILLWGTKHLSEKRLAMPRPPLFFFFTAFLLWTSVSFLWAENTQWALRKIAFLLPSLLLFLVFFSVCREAHSRDRILRAFSVGAFLAALVAIAQFSLQFVFGIEKVFAFWTREVLPFFLGPAFSESVAHYPSLLVNIAGTTVMRASGFFPDPHMAAFFFGMAIPIAVSFAWGGGNRMRKRWVVCAAVILIADLLTFSRGGYVGLIVGLLVFVFPLLRWTSWKKRILPIIMSIIIAAVILSASPVGTRLLSSFSQTDTSNIERLRLWQEATELIVERPILGAGLGNYPLAVKPSAEYREPIYAHNLFLDIALETGLTGAFFFVGFLFLGILSLWRRWRRERAVFQLAIFSALVIFSVHSLFETPLFSVHVLPVFLLLMAASLASPSTERSGAANIGVSEKHLC